MMMILAFILAAVAVEVPIARVIDDAKAIDRVAAASKRDMPHDLMRRILNEDIETLRGRRSDATYEYAGFERFDSGRITQSTSVGTKDQTIEIRGSFVYKLQIESPSRRMMLMTKNRHVYLDHLEIDYLPVSGTQKTQTMKLETWLEPGQNKSVDFEAIAKQATVRLFAHADEKNGYGNLVLTLVQARVFDNPDSPYADAVASAKAILRALDHDDVPSIRAMAARMVNDLSPSVGAGAPARTAAGEAPAATQELYAELQAIEDLLTGTESERRQGLERLHQLVRKLRTH
ncbi:MAG TPA: hypothetical protein VER58_17490 [Thermoanaerobaculia bacterium]|nr:hypothetical protein [Thermoanaerobaculia bacterium]